MGDSAKRVLVLRPAPFSRTQNYTGFKVPGTPDWTPPGMVWGSGVSTPGIFGRPWEAADFPFSDRPVLGVLTFELMSGAVEKFWQTLRWQSSITDRDAYSHFPIRASRSCTTTIGVKTHSGACRNLVAFHR